MINPDLQEAFSPVPFTYDLPAITNVTPSSGPVGTSVTISGVNFFGGVNSVTFGGIAASFTVNSDSRSPRRYRAVSRRSGVHRGLGAELRQQLVPIHGDVFADHADGDAERTDDVLSGRQRDVDRPVRFPSYLWSPNGETTQSILVTAGGNYSVTVTDVNGCTGSSSPTTVIVNAAPLVSITASARPSSARAAARR